MSEHFNGTIIHVDRGLDKPYARAYHGVVDSRYRLFHNDSEYACGRYPPNYPMPAIPTRVEYIFGYGLADGIFIRVNEVIEAGAYRDGMLAVLPYTVN